jgi:hypothetical protein
MHHDRTLTAKYGSLSHLDGGTILTPFTFSKPSGTSMPPETLSANRRETKSSSGILESGDHKIQTKSAEANHFVGRCM